MILIIPKMNKLSLTFIPDYRVVLSLQHHNLGVLVKTINCTIHYFEVEKKLP